MLCTLRSWFYGLLNTSLVQIYLHLFWLNHQCKNMICNLNISNDISSIYVWFWLRIWLEKCLLKSEWNSREIIKIKWNRIGDLGWIRPIEILNLEPKVWFFPRFSWPAMGILPYKRFFVPYQHKNSVRVDDFESLTRKVGMWTTGVVCLVTTWQSQKSNGRTLNRYLYLSVSKRYYSVYWRLYSFSCPWSA